MEISGLKISNHIELKPKSVLMVIGAGCVIWAFFSAGKGFALPLFIAGMFFILIAGDYYKEIN